MISPRAVGPKVTLSLSYIPSSVSWDDAACGGLSAPEATEAMLSAAATGETASASASVASSLSLLLAATIEIDFTLQSTSHFSLL